MMWSIAAGDLPPQVALDIVMTDPDTMQPRLNERRDDS
jgi:hypothetical protein